MIAALRKAHPGTRFNEVVLTEVPDLYEVWMNGTVAYVSSRNPRFFVFGRLFDTRTMRDLTAPRLAARQPRTLSGSTRDPAVDAFDELPAAGGAAVDDGVVGDGGAGSADAHDESGALPLPLPLGDLPLADALLTVHGNGERQLAVFSDPGCGYCRQLERELARLTNVTIHTFIVPFQGHSRPVAIWCAADREDAWRQWMLHGDAAPHSRAFDCTHPIDRNLALARRWQVSATPTLIWPDGQRTVGYLNLEAIDARLKLASPMPSRAPPPASPAPASPERRP